MMNMLRVPRAPPPPLPLPPGPPLPSFIYLLKSWNVQWLSLAAIPDIIDYLNEIN